jgi:phage-related baseplate assembly protein
MSSTSTTVDLSLLSPPKLVQELDVEAIYDEMVSDFLAKWEEKRAARPTLPEITTLNLETDPVAVAFEVAAAREVKIRARINGAAVARLIAFATGSDLDHIAANYGVVRLVVQPATDTTAVVMESDERFRRRILLRMEAFSSAGPAGAYVYYALTADATLRDASAITQSPGKVTVTLLKSATDPIPSNAQIAAVALALSEEDARPLTDMVSVNAPQIVSTPIVAELTIYPGPDGNVVRQTAVDQINAFLLTNAYLGRNLSRSALFSRLHVEGVMGVRLVSPAQDIVIDQRQAIQISSVSVTVTGVDT